MNEMQRRHAAGTSQGGRFARHHRAESSVSLDPAFLARSRESFGDQPDPDLELELELAALRG